MSKEELSIDQVPMEEIKSAEKEAKKPVQEHYVQIKIGYEHYVLTHKAASKMLTLLSSAEMLKTKDGLGYVTPLTSSTIYSSPFEISTIPYENYIDMKMNHILKITKKPEEEETY